MEDVISYVSHIAGAVLFCIALTLLFLIGKNEERVMDQMYQTSIESAIDLPNTQ